MTYELRNTRHKHEQAMLEQDRLVDLLRKDIDAHNKVKRKLSVQLDKRKSNLREFMLEKQNCLNDIDQVVVLRYDQIRAAAIQGCTGPEGLSKTVVFPEAVLMRLRKRVLELQEEIRLQKLRQKVNRTHLFRMNIDIRWMEAKAEEYREEMRDVLTKKLGKPRRVDKTLDDLLRQMARRHKYSATLGVIPQVWKQIRGWRDRHSDLEQKYLDLMNRRSDRLRLAAALQADVLPQKPPKSVGPMAGGYDADIYHRDVIRLRIVRSQQMQQIKAIRDEIKSLRLKPVSPRPPLPSSTPPREGTEDIYLFMTPRTIWRPKRKYFPITPLGSQVKLVYDINVMKLLYDCLDAMRVTRDDAPELLRDLTAQLPDVLSGAKSRYEVVDTMVKKWLLKYGGDPSMYKKQTRAFDALAALADRLVRQHVETLEGSGSHEVMEGLESALKAVSDEKQPLATRLGQALGALFLCTAVDDLDTIETMASLVNSLIDEEHPLTAESIEHIEIFSVVEDIKDCGVVARQEDLEEIVVAAIEALKAQLTTPEEVKELEEEVEKAMAVDKKSLKSTTFSIPPTVQASRAPSITPSETRSTRAQSVASIRSKHSGSVRKISTQRSEAEHAADSTEGSVSGHTTDTGERTESAYTSDTERGESMHSGPSGDAPSVHVTEPEDTASAPEDTGHDNTNGSREPDDA